MRRLVLVLAAAGCSAEVHHTADGGPPDVMVDALGPSQGTAPPNAVKLHVTQHGAPVPNVAVYFQATDSTPIVSNLTDAQGETWAVMPAGGFVTAQRNLGPALDELTTFSAVQAGDDLRIDLDPTGSTLSATATLQLTAVTNAAAYKLYSPCGAVVVESVTAAISLAGCTNPTDVVVVPLDGNGDPVGTALYAQSVALDTGAIDLRSYPYENLVTNTYSFTNVPTSVQYVAVYGALSAERRAFEASAGGGVTSGSASTELRMPSSAGTELTVATEFPASGELGRQTIYNWHATTATYNLDIASVELPRYTSTPVVADHKLTWTERGAGSTPDLVRADVHAYRSDFPQGHSWKWRIVAPRSGTTVTFPTLPAFGFDYNIRATDTIGVDELMLVALPGGYAGTRAHAFAEITRAISGTLGRIVVETLYFETL